MTEAHQLPIPPSLSLAEAIEAIRIDNLTYPREAIDVILHHRDEAIPQLINIVEEIIKDPEAYWERHTQHNARVHLYALELLSKFQATEAHSTIVSLVTLKHGIVDELFGRYLETLLPETLSNTAGSNFEHLKRLVTLYNDMEICDSIPLAAVDALYLGVLCGEADRVEILDHLAEILRSMDDDYRIQQDHIIGAMVGLYPEKQMDVMSEVLSRRKNYEVAKEKLNNIMKEGLEQTLESAKSHLSEHHFPEDIHERLLMKVQDDDCYDCGHDHHGHHHHDHHHHTSGSNSRPQKQALPRNQRLKNKKKERANQRQARKKNRRK